MRVLASALGQTDNVGDTVLRRAFLATLREAGDLHVLVGARDDDHLSGLGLEPGDTVVRDREQWRQLVRTSLTRDGALYAFDTGETDVRSGTARRYLRLWPLLALNRRRGGSAVHLGVGIRHDTPWLAPVRTVLRRCELVTWRDERSRRLARVGTVAPDWAFGTGSSADELAAIAPASRDRLAIAVRASLAHDPRPEPDDAWIDAIGAMASGLGLTPVTTAQIGRDGDLATRIAARLGAEAVLWESPNHTRQEERLRETYRRSALVLSDRLHGLVMAATEGAMPVALARSPLDKTSRTLDAVGLGGAAVHPRLPDRDAAYAALSAATERINEVPQLVAIARERLADVTAAVAAIGRGSR